MKLRLRLATLSIWIGAFCTFMLFWTSYRSNRLPFSWWKPVVFQKLQKRQGIHGFAVWNSLQTEPIGALGGGGGGGGGGKEWRGENPHLHHGNSGSESSVRLMYTHDNWPDFPTWPVFKKNPKGPLPPTPFHPPYTIHWDFHISAFLQRPHVNGKPPKLITWMERVPYLPSIPEPVRLRVCPEMPCRITTERRYRPESAALLWNAQAMTDKHPPDRANPDQVYILHNQERQDNTWDKQYRKTFKSPAWRSAFNWTMSFRTDADILAPYGYLVKQFPLPKKDYDAILRRKEKMAVWVVSHCSTHGKREKYVKKMQDFVPVDIYGSCGTQSCGRAKDDKCLETISQRYKFYLAFENTLCPDYITEKLFRYYNTDMVLVARGGEGYEHHLPPGTYINTNDFRSVEELTQHLKYLDRHPEEYIKILQTKDQYQSIFEEYPHRGDRGQVTFVHYHYEAVAFCELCRRLWEVDSYRKTIPSIVDWFNKGNCVPPSDMGRS